MVVAWQEGTDLGRWELGAAALGAAAPVIT